MNNAAGIEAEDQEHDAAEARSVGDVVRGLNQSVRDKLPRWIREGGAKKDDAEGTDVEDGIGKAETEDSCLITPGESPERTMTGSSRGYGGIDESTPIPSVADTQVQKKKGKGRVIGDGKAD